MNTQEVLKRDCFVVKSIVIGECISLLNFGYYFCLMGHTSKAEYPMVLYNACLDPWSQFHTSISKVMPLNQIIVFLSTLVNFSSNLFLYRFLSNKTNKNTWMNETNRKKDRKRNLIPANVGMTVLTFYGVSVGLFMLTYTYKSNDFDSATRAFLNAAFVDITYCITNPVIIILGSVDARRKFTDFWLKVTKL